MVDTIKIGTEVWVFDTEAKDPELRADMVCGSFINLETGDLYYYTTKFKQPAYAVAETKEGAEEKLKKFLEFREFIRSAQAEVDSRRGELVKENYKDVVEAFYKKWTPTEVANEQENV